MSKSLVKPSPTPVIVLIALVSIFHLSFTDRTSHDLWAKETPSYPSFAVLELLRHDNAVRFYASQRLIMAS